MTTKKNTKKKQKETTSSLTAKQLERLLQKRDEEKAKENGQVVGGIFVFVIIVALLVGAGFGVYYLIRNRNEDRAIKGYKSCYALYGDSDRCEDFKHDLMDNYWGGLSNWEKGKKLSALQKEACNEYSLGC